jgi:hypothetical protein
MLRLELGKLAPQLLDLYRLRLHLPAAGQGLHRIGRQIPRPFAQGVLVNIQILRRLRNADPALLDQAHSLELELTPRPSSPIVHLQLQEIPHLGVHEAGSRPPRPDRVPVS